MSLAKILVAQGGGPTAVINQSLVGVVLEARRQAGVGKVYGARHGVRGIVNEDFVDLTQETSHNLELVASTPASALGSTRDKPDAACCHEIFTVLQAHGITQNQVRDLQTLVPRFSGMDVELLAADTGITQVKESL